MSEHETQERVPLPWSRGCLVCGEANPHGLRGRSYRVGDRIELPFVARPEYAGWSEVIHGGFIATVLDEVMTWAAIVTTAEPCFAAEFSVRLRRPLPPGTACVAEATVQGERRGIHGTEGVLRGEDGTVYARATGRYVVVPGQRLEDLRRDFVTDENCPPLSELFRGAQG